MTAQDIKAQRAEPHRGSVADESPTRSADANLKSFFATGRCPDCGHDRWRKSEDGGHDVVLACAKCGARFGVQEAPFNLIERIE